MFAPQTLAKVLKALFMRKFFGRATPLSVTFLTTHRCNFDCEACDIQLHPGRDIGTESFKTLIADIARAGAVRVSFTGGGEPLMRRDIGEMIDTAKKHRLIVSLVTNGYFIDKRLDILKKLDLLLVSYDKSKKLADKSSPLERVLKNAILARENGIPVVLQSVLTRDTCNHVEDFFAISHRHGFVISMQPLGDWHQGIAPESITPSVEEMGMAIDKILAEKRKFNNILNTVKYLKTVKRLWLRPNRKGNCTAGIFYASVTADGFLYPCNPFINKGRRISALEKPFLTAFRKQEAPACQGCLWNCHLELNNMFAFDLGTLLNLVRFSRNRIVYRKGIRKKKMAPVIQGNPDRSIPPS